MKRKNTEYDMPLFKTTLLLNIIVEADNAQAARVVGQQHAKDAVHDLYYANLNVTVDPQQITTVDLLPADWGVECLPYGGDGEYRIKDILGEQS